MTAILKSFADCFTYCWRWGDLDLTRFQKPQVSIHAPSLFIQTHWQQLLPQWHQPVRSVLIYLQYSPSRLCDRTPRTEAIKQQLREQFLELSSRWRQILLGKGFQAEPFDPKSGLPIYSSPGDLSLDDVVVAHVLLNLPMEERGGCRILAHPQWNTAVFPATFLCSATPEQLNQIFSSAGDQEIG